MLLQNSRKWLQFLEYAGILALKFTQSRLTLGDILIAMSRIRTIKPQFFMNDELGALYPLDRLLFIGLWTMADREGRLEERPAKIKAAILPYDNHNVERAIDRLEQKGFIERYEAEGKRYIEITNFTKHQYPNSKEPPSTIPASCRHSAGTVRVPCRHDAGTLRLGKGKEGKEEGEKAKERSAASAAAGEGMSPHAFSRVPAKESGKDPPDNRGNASPAILPLRAAEAGGHGRASPGRCATTPGASHGRYRPGGKYDGIAEKV